MTFEQLNMIKAYNADCMQIMQLYPDKYFDLAIIEKDKDYYDAAIKRIKLHQRQQVLQFD